ncbi:M1 family aminopeptidase [Mucilaginibacter ximonensis]|uniref:Aminopeptidase N n=1 Tax=Mucilaginibacter ximonensis TaxID=538021 RepID=A0ABW5YAK2_9SPHI
MKFFCLAIIIIGSIGTCIPKSTVAQSARITNSTLSIYRETPTKYSNLVHTRLNVRFDYKKRYLYGKEWVTLKPQFYPTDSLSLDAKGMDLRSVVIVKNGRNLPLKFTYDSLVIKVRLDRTYYSNETYTIYIDYIARPNEFKAQGSMAIADAKGLYFVNPDGTERDKPIQIWTQGETEGSSVWFPTIDKPNQKTTDEISMTVPAKYVTLSNGRLASQKVNSDGTRTDTWKMELPHSPYLFMMAVGDFKIIKDTWRGKEVSYYLEPKYAPYARDIFGFTPEVLGFYSRLLGVDYPWNKYSQIVVRDYVSGAMENTSATLHGDYVQATKRELLDDYYGQGKSTIVHELFHQWFGDYVTAESWSNLTVNESFADFSETLWAEYKYGKDAGDAHINADRQTYLSQPALYKNKLVRFHYHDKEDMFDAVTYQKGASVLYMLRNYLGKEAFYKGLNIYLTTNAFKNGEAEQLRLALEEASGRDLTWFFNQWYFGSGHPILDITYKWNDAAKTQTVYINQKQDEDAFILPIAVDVYSGGKAERKQFWIRSKIDSLVFHADVKPSLINVDGDKMLLAQKTDNKTIDEFAFQYFNAPLYLDRFEAIDAAIKFQKNPIAQKVIIAALHDKYFELQLKAIRGADLNKKDVCDFAQPVLVQLAEHDPNTLVRAAAIAVLGKLKSPGNKGLFKRALKSQSYAILQAALNALVMVAPQEALKVADTFINDSYNGLKQAALMTYATAGADNEWPMVYNAFIDGSPQTQFDLIQKIGGMTGRLRSVNNAKKGIEAIIEFGKKYEAYGLGVKVTRILKEIEEARAKAGDASLNSEIEKGIAVLTGSGGK